MQNRFAPMISVLLRLVLSISIAALCSGECANLKTQFSLHGCYCFFVVGIFIRGCQSLSHKLACTTRTLSMICVPCFLFVWSPLAFSPLQITRVTGAKKLLMEHSGIPRALVDRPIARASLGDNPPTHTHTHIHTRTHTHTHTPSMWRW